MKLTAIIPHYWEGRDMYLPTILQRLLEDSTVKPSKVIVLNNSKNELSFNHNNVEVANMTTNFGPRARHAIAMLEPSDYYFTQDDDLLVQEKTIENLLRFKDESGCLGLIGKKINSKQNPYTTATHIQGNKIIEPEPVDVLVGRIRLMTAKTIIKGFSRLIENKMYHCQEEDLMFSYGNKPVVVPTTQDEYFTSLDEYNTGLCHRDNHMDIRNKVLKKLMEHK